MSWSASGKGNRNEIGRALRKATGDGAIARAVDSVIMLFPASTAIEATTSGHIADDGSGTATITVKIAAPKDETRAADEAPPPAAPPGRPRASKTE